MEDIGTAVHVYLQTVATVTEIAGSRGTPGVLKQGTKLPAYTYTVISSNSVRDVESGPSGLTESRVQIDAYDDNYQKSNDLAKRIYLAIMTNARPLTMNGIGVDRVTREGVQDFEEAPTDGSDTWRYRRSIDYMILHDETQP